MKTIEVCCTGNHGRSPLMELKAEMVLRELGLTRKYEVISTGTRVAELRSGVIPYQDQEKIVNKAIERGDIYNSCECLYLLDNLGKVQDLGAYWKKALDQFIREEEENRHIAVKHFSLEGMIKPFSQQTVPRAGVVLVLASDPKNRDRASDIYSTSRYSPLITTVAEYATNDPDARIEGSLGGKRETFLSMCAVLLDYTDKAIRRTVKEFS